jgi:transposase
MHNDETGIRWEGKTQWIHVSSTQQNTHYAIDEKRGKEAMDRINILPRFWGTSVHDRWASYEKYSHCDHAYCMAHSLRVLNFAAEELGKPWAAQMQTTLLNAYGLSKQKQIKQSEITAIEKKYDEIVNEGIKQEPLPLAAIHKRGRKAKGKSLKLLECFRDKKKEYMGFLYDKNIPFDNNLAERDLRMVKLKQKISGCFRTRKGAEMFCRIRSYISTIKKQGGNIWDALQLSIKSSTLHPIMVRGG